MGHEEKGKGDDIVLTGGAPKSDNALRALWIDGSVCLLLLSGVFSKHDPEEGSINFSDGRGIWGSLSGEVLRWGNTCESRGVWPLNDGSRSL